MPFLARIASASIWAPGALDHEPKKFRSLWRVWLPLYDILAVVAGILAALFGSQILFHVFGYVLVPILGVAFAAASFVAFLGVAFPRLWRVEVAAKCVMIGMVVGYVFCILFLPSDRQIASQGTPAFFVACMLLVGLPLVAFRLSMLSEEWFERRVEARRRELADE